MKLYNNLSALYKNWSLSNQQKLNSMWLNRKFQMFPHTLWETSIVHDTRHPQHTYQNVSNTTVNNSTYKSQHTIHLSNIIIFYIITDCKTISSKWSPTKIMLQFYSVYCQCSKLTINVDPQQTIPIIWVKWISNDITAFATSIRLPNK